MDSFMVDTVKVNQVCSAVFLAKGAQNPRCSGLTPCMG